MDNQILHDKRRIVCSIIMMHLIFFVAIILPCKICLAKGDDDSVKASKKIISIVYDDSGSMYTENKKPVVKWAQANYAIQAFAALLNDQDRMFITYMSDADKVPGNNGEKVFEITKEDAVELDMKHADDAVKQIRSKADRGDTPIQAVDAAMDKLRDTKDADENTQFWLVVITDGRMFSGEKKKEEGNKAEKIEADLQGKLNDFVGENMSNGSEVYITYLGIGEDEKDAEDIQGNSSAGFDAQKTTDIVDALSEIANKVSGRTRFDDADISQIDSKTIKVHTDIPLYSVSVFSQRSNAQVDEIRTISNVRNIPLKYPDSPDPQKYITDEDLYGNATLASNADGSLIQPGDYEIVFSEDVSPKDTVIMYQPAIKMVPSVTKNGTKLDVNKLEKKTNEGDKIDIELIPVNPETGDPIDESLLPDGITWSIDYLVDGKEKEHSDGRIMKGVEVETGENKIVCVMKIPDMTPQKDSYVFRIDKPVSYDITMDGSATHAIFKRGKMGKNNYVGNPIVMNITADGAPLDKKAMKEIDFDVTDVTLDDSKVTGSFFETSGWKMAKTATGTLKDGSFTVYPKWSLLPFLIKPGEYHFKVKATFPDGSVKEMESSYSVVGHWKDWLVIFILLAIVALFLYIVVGLIIVKPKFSGQRVVMRVYTSNGRSGGVLNANLGRTENLHSFRSLKDFTPMPSVCYLGPVKLTAGADGAVYIDKATIRRYVRAGTSVLNPITQFARLVQTLRLTRAANNNAPAPQVRDHYLGAQHYYLYSVGEMLYEIFVN